MKINFPTLFLLALMLMSPSSDLAQELRWNSDLSIRTLRVNVNLVTFSFTIMDTHRRSVENISKADINVYEDDVQQEISQLDQDSEALSLIVLVDSSESTEPFSAQIRTTTSALVDILHEDDEVAVMSFSDLPNMLQDSTVEREKIRAALYQASGRFFGATNINDSIYLAARKFSSRRTSRKKLIVLVSDGKGNRGEYERALTQLKVSGATLLEVRIGTPSKYFGSGWIMNRWIKEGAGSILPYSSEEIRQRLFKTLTLARHHYSAAYVPSNKDRDGKFRRLRVEIARTSPLAQKMVIIQNPEGYFAARSPLD